VLRVLPTAEWILLLGGCKNSPDARAMSQSPKRFLLLEDDPNDVDLICRSLTARWPDCSIIRVTTETCFAEALEGGGFDVILSDYAVPGFHGTEALAMARQRRPEVPFLFISGAIGDEVAIESLKAGATDYVLKDELVRLTPAVQRALDE